jgi:hypothetical protein
MMVIENIILIDEELLKSIWIIIINQNGSALFVPHQEEDAEVVIAGSSTLDLPPI